MNQSILLQIPVPKDIPLPLPMPEWFLVAILIISFLIHILFINLMVGGSILTFWYELKGIKDKKYDLFAHEIAKTITVNKSLAIVMGVAPLLSINVLYTIYFYSANALTGNMWISIIPWVAFAFLMIYLHKYTWSKLEDNKTLHLSILSIGVFSFLIIPFIFLTNINLMLFPEEWGNVKGFADALTMPNVFPRYLHFITASLAITGVFLAVYFGRKAFSEKLSLSKPSIIKKMLGITFTATLFQFLFGPLLFLTLPGKGVDWNLFFIILGGVIVAVYILVLLWRYLNSEQFKIDKTVYRLIGAFSLLVIFMGTGRHLYRENSLRTHKKMVAERTEAHWEQVAKAHEGILVPEELKQELSVGEQLFQNNCAVCHSATARLVGPPMAEVTPDYTNNIEGLKSWIKEPGRKRMDYPAMTGFPQLSNEQLTDIASFVINKDWKN